jgi:hypothetical protein
MAKEPTKILIGKGDYRRSVPAIPSVILKNRFFETNPVLNEDQTSLISRPGMKKITSIGDGLIRKVFSEPGTFSDSLFVASGTDLYKLTLGLTSSLLGAIGTSVTDSVEMAAAANLGEGAIPERLFIADGGILWVYMENGQSLGALTASGAPADTDTVTIGTTVYRFTTGSVDAGTPAGTGANPWLVARTGVAATDIQALFRAINDSGTAGTEYSTALIAHTTVEAYNVTSNTLYVVARVYGTAGDAIVTTEASANLAWGAGTLQDGGEAHLRQVPMPNDVGAISVAHINQYIIVIPAQGNNINGRFYWIDPGEVTVDPLNFATAERAPDACNQVVVYSDMIWLCGQTTTEPWVTTGDADAPFQRFRGILYDRGCWEGTACKVKDSLILCDQDGAVFQVQGGLKRISRPDIEERIRAAITVQNQNT